MRSIAGALVAITLAAGALAAEDVTEPRSGVRFPVKTPGGDMSLLGVGLRTKTFLKVKVYALGLYVSDAALAGPLAPHKPNIGTPAFYKELVGGDFPKQVTMRFVRDLSADQIQAAFREVLEGASPSKVDLFVGYFSSLRVGQEVVLRWAPGGTLETTVAGLGKPPIADKAFAAAVFGIWLGEKPIQEDIKKDLVARAGGLIR